MRYEPFSPNLDAVSNIMVDSGRMNATVLELSHWPGNRTPKELKADTSAEIVINFLRSPLCDEYLGKAQVVSVSNDHYDVDGLLSVWSVLEPEQALKHADLIIGAAVTGDFDQYTSDEAAKVCFTLDEFQATCLQPFISSSAWSGEEVTAFIYKRLLEFLPEVIENVNVFQHIWQGPLRRVHHAMEMFARKEVSVQSYPELDLAIISSPEKLHPYALHNQVSASRILVSCGNIHQFYYRYESFVELVSRPVLKRVPLEGLIVELQKLEQSPGQWFSESIHTAHPAVRLYTNARVPSQSSLSAQEFARVVLGYLSDNRDKTSSIDGNYWMNNTSVLPPSLDPRRK